jgi:hypothetical protein
MLARPSSRGAAVLLIGAVLVGAAVPVGGVKGAGSTEVAEARIETVVDSTILVVPASEIVFFTVELG